MRFLIINPFGIGDVLNTTPVIRAIKNSGNKVFVGYWCNKRLEGVLKANRYIDEIFALSRGDLKHAYSHSFREGLGAFLDLLRRIKLSHFDVAIDFSLDHRYSLLCLLLGIRRRIGFNFKSRGRFLSEKIDFSGYENRHVVEYYLDLVRKLGLDLKNSHMDLFIDESDKIWADDFIKSHNVKDADLLIGIASGGGLSWGDKAALRYWPKERFGEVADILIQRLGAKVIFMGDARDMTQTDGITALMNANSINAVGKTTLTQCAALMKRCQVMITNDGGPMHMAVAADIKSVSLIGPVDEHVYGPYPVSDRHVVLCEKMECRPCYNKFRMNQCLNDNKCLKDITVKAVSEAVEKILQT